MKYFIAIIAFIIAALCSKAYPYNYINDYFSKNSCDGGVFTKEGMLSYDYYLNDEAHLEYNALNSYTGDEYDADFYEQDAANLFRYTDIADNI